MSVPWSTSLQTIRSTGRRAQREAAAYLRDALSSPTDPGTRTLLFAQGRTGSTLLESLLCSTGHFRKNGEVLKDAAIRVRFPERYVRGLSRDPVRCSPDGNFVCHVKLYHLTDHRKWAGGRPVAPAVFLRRLSEDGWRIIYLRREDRIHHTVSNLAAAARGTYHKTDDRPENTRVHVERDKLERWVRRREQYEREERQALAGLPFHEVVYERDLLDGAVHQATTDAVLDFLSLERRPVQTELRKVNARPLSELVDNYDEFSEWVRALGLEASLETGKNRT